MNMEYWPTVVQVMHGTDHMVYLWFTDGTVRLYDATPLLSRGYVFDRLKDEAFFHDAMTVMNGTLAWDLSGCRDETNCIDLDPYGLYEESPIVADPLEIADKTIA